MADKILIVTSDENIITADYSGLKSLQRAVNGNIELFHTMTFRFDFLDKKIKTVLYCNDEFLLTDDEEYRKVNAFASLVCQREIRGNIVIISDGSNSEDGGFSTQAKEDDYSDCELMITALKQYMENNKAAIASIHNSLDNKKSEPDFKFVQRDDFIR